MEATAAKLMDFSQPMDVPLLDQVVTTAFDASHPQVRKAWHSLFCSDRNALLLGSSILTAAPSETQSVKTLTVADSALSYCRCRLWSG